MLIIYLIVVFFGTDPVGVVLEKEFTTLKDCLSVAEPIALVAPKDAPARGFCVAKEVKVKA